MNQPMLPEIIKERLQAPADKQTTTTRDTDNEEEESEEEKDATNTNDHQEENICDTFNSPRSLFSDIKTPSSMNLSYAFTTPKRVPDNLQGPTTTQPRRVLNMMSPVRDPLFAAAINIQMATTSAQDKVANTTDPPVPKQTTPEVEQQDATKHVSTEVVQTTTQTNKSTTTTTRGSTTAAAAVQPMAAVQPTTAKQPPKTPAVSVLEQLPFRLTQQSVDNIERLRQQIKQGTTVAVATIGDNTKSTARKEDGNSTTESEDDDDATVDIETQETTTTKPVKPTPSKRTTSPTKRRADNTTVKTPKNKKQKTTKETVVEAIVVPEVVRPDDAICIHPISIFDFKQMEPHEIPYYLKPDEYLHGMVCSGCSKSPADETGKRVHSWYMCPTDFRIVQLDMDGDEEAETGRCNTLLCVACWESKQPQSTGRRSSRRRQA